MDDQDRFLIQLHEIKHGSLGGQVGDALLHERRLGAVKDDELRRMKGKPEILVTRALSERAQFSRAVVDLAVELRQFRMGYIRRDVGRHAVHPDLVGGEIIENAMKITNRNPEMRLLSPPPAVVALEIRRAENFHGKAEPCRVDWSRRYLRPVAVNWSSFH